MKDGVCVEITRNWCVQNNVEFDYLVEDCMKSTECITDLSIVSSAE